MPKPAKLYTAPTYAGPPLTIGQIAALAGCSYVNAFERIQEGKPVGGHVWQPTGAAQWKPAEPGTPERKRVGRGIPSRVHNGAVVDPPQSAAPAPPERTQFGAKLRKEIVCWCEDCRGRRWTLDEIRACPGFPAGLVINGMTLRRVGQAVGHPLQYPRADGTTAGVWRKNGAAVAPVAPAALEPRGAWRFGTSPEAYDLFPTRERAPVLDSGAIGGRGEM